MFKGYDPSKRFCQIVDKVSRTIQDAIVDVPSLLKVFDGHLDDLFNKYNNGLLYESQSGVGVFIDELNADEVARYNKFVADKEAREAEQKRQDELFEQFKNDIASGAYKRRVEASSVETEQNGETKPSVQ